MSLKSIDSLMDLVTQIVVILSTRMVDCHPGPIFVGHMSKCSMYPFIFSKFVSYLVTISHQMLLRN